MESYDNVNKMYCKFSIKDLELLGKEYTLGEKNRKILNAYPKIGRVKLRPFNRLKI